MGRLVIATELPTYTVSPVEKLTNQKRTGSTPRAYLDRTKTVPRVLDRTSTAPRVYLDRTTSVQYLDSTRTVPRPHHERTSTAPAYSTLTAPRMYALTIPYKSLIRVTVNRGRTELDTIVRAINVAVQFLQELYSSSCT